MRSKPLRLMLLLMAVTWAAHSEASNATARATCTTEP